MLRKSRPIAVSPTASIEGIRNDGAGESAKYITSMHTRNARPAAVALRYASSIVGAAVMPMLVQDFSR